MICKNCGKEITERKPFCTECGAPLIWEDETKPTEIPDEAPVQQPYAAPAAPAYQAPAASVYTAPAPQQTYAPPAYQAQTAPIYTAPLPVQEKKKGKGGKIALIIVTIVLALALIAAGVVAFLLYRENQEMADSVSSMEAENTELREALEKSAADYTALNDDYSTLQADFEEYQRTNELSTSEYDELVTDYNALQEEYDRILEEYDFYNWHAVVCSEDNQYYHTYDCIDWNRDYFWIFNSEYAKYKEYTPCPNCQPQGDIDEP